MAMRALVVGGTGPTGPHVVRCLLERGHDVTIFHRGAHEPPDLPGVEHVHGDPHFPESISAALGSRAFDLVVAHVRTGEPPRSGPRRTMRPAWRISADAEVCVVTGAPY
jgi:nucleoside-diphosphate-sugar epimerase